MIRENLPFNFDFFDPLTGERLSGVFRNKKSSSGNFKAVVEFAL